MKLKKSLEIEINTKTDPDLVYFLEKITNLSLTEAYDFALKLEKRNYLKEAKKIHKAIIISNPDFIVSKIDLAEILIKSKEYDEAEDIFIELLEDKNVIEKSEIRHNLGLIYWYQNKKEKAVKLWKQIISQNQEMLKSYDALIYNAKQNGDKQQVKSLTRRRKISHEKGVKQAEEWLNLNISDITENPIRNWFDKIVDKILNLW